MFYFRNHSYLLVISLLIFSNASFSQHAEKGAADAFQWLADMNHAMKMQSFQGDVAYLKNNQMETIRVTHDNHNGVEREHLITLSGPKREVILEQDKVTCYFLDSKTKITNYNNPQSLSLFGRLPKELKKHRRYYRFILAGSEQISGREARKVSIIPNDSLRYGQKIWIDSESKLPLKYELFDQNGMVIEQMIFTTLSLMKQISSEHFDLEVDAGDFKEIRRLKIKEEAVEQSDWRFEVLPAGFQVMTHTRQILDENKKGPEQITLSDGLVSVSVYIEKNSQSRKVSKAGQFGGVNGYMRAVNDYLVIVVGEVPAETTRLIGDAIRWNKS
jgi:sigma-E factor negative regulatory protein RseB